jgi:Polysaccharide lyase/PKD domain
VNPRTLITAVTAVFLLVASAATAQGPTLAPPTAAYTFLPTNPVVGDTVSFDGNSSACPAVPCTYRWHHAGQTFGRGPTASYTYTTATTKTVTLEVTDSLGRMDAEVKQFNVRGTLTPAPPTAAYTFWPTNPVVGDSVSFDGNSSTCPAVPCTYRWRHAGQTFGTGPTASYSYTTATTKTVTLEVTDSLGRMDAEVKQFDVLAALPTSGTVLFRGDFETGDFSQWYRQCLSYRASVGSSNPAPFLGRYRSRFEVRDGDVDPDTGSERCEVSGPRYPDGTELWQRFAVYLPPGFTAQSWFMFQQWHGQGGQGNAALGFMVHPSTQRLYLSHGGGGYRYWTGPVVQPDRWYDLLLHIKFSDDPSIGFVELWLDGTMQTMANGSQRRYGPTSEPCLNGGCSSSYVYPKMGIYRGREHTNSQVVWADHFLLGTSSAAVGR